MARFLYYYMPFPLIGLASGHIARFGLQTVLKQGSGQFVQALPFGAGYSLGTWLGFPKNYQSKSSNSKRTTYNLSMPYGRTRKIRVWSRRYRRYVWVYPRRTSYSRYTRRYNSYRRRY